VVDGAAVAVGPCRVVSPALEQLARDLAGQVKLVKVNAGTSPRISQRFGAQAIPALLVLRRGQVTARQAGAAPWPPCGPGSATRSPAPLTESLFRPSYPALQSPAGAGPCGPFVPAGWAERPMSPAGPPGGFPPTAG
jgi:thiol-disulfide isomerase/thioredoxin